MKPSIPAVRTDSPTPRPAPSPTPSPEWSLPGELSGAAVAEAEARDGPLAVGDWFVDETGVGDIKVDEMDVDDVDVDDTEVLVVAAASSVILK